MIQLWPRRALIPGRPGSGSAAARHTRRSAVSRRRRTRKAGGKASCEMAHPVGGHLAARSGGSPDLGQADHHAPERLRQDLALVLGHGLTKTTAPACVSSQVAAISLTFPELTSALEEYGRVIFRTPAETPRRRTMRPATRAPKAVTSLAAWSMRAA